jgi:ABC-type amino acid transport substrate-binding protein
MKDLKQVMICCFAFLLAITCHASFSYSLPISNKNLKLITIKVGAGIRPPFLIEDGKGMGAEIIAVFNSIKKKFHFELIHTPIKRRVRSLEDGLVDVFMWDNLNWGWQASNLKASLPILYSKDVFLTQSSAIKSQSYFDNFENKRICGVNGYHYKFINYSTNPRELSKKFNHTQVRTEEESIKMALLNRCDISVASQSAIDWFFINNADLRNKILISEKFDTEFSRHFLVPDTAPILVSDINNIILKANELSLLEGIYKKYGQAFPEQ